MGGTVLPSTDTEDKLMGLLEDHQREQSGKLGYLHGRLKRSADPPRYQHPKVRNVIAWRKAKWARERELRYDNTTSKSVGEPSDPVRGTE